MAARAGAFASRRHRFVWMFARWRDWQ